MDFLESRRFIEPLRTLIGQRTPMHATIAHAGVRALERGREVGESAKPPRHLQSAEGAGQRASADRLGHQGGCLEYRGNGVDH